MTFRAAQPEAVHHLTQTAAAVNENNATALVAAPMHAVCHVSERERPGVLRGEEELENHAKAEFCPTYRASCYRDCLCLAAPEALSQTQVSVLLVGFEGTKGCTVTLILPLSTSPEVEHGAHFLILYYPLSTKRPPPRLLCA
jgi:hypothetical protein